MTPRERRLWIAFAVSAALNLFLLGFVVARGFGHRPHHGGAGPFHGELFDLHGSPELRARFESQKERLRPTHLALRKARKDVERALLAEPYDRARVERALEELRKQTATVQLGMHEALVDIAGELEPERRRAFVRENFGHRRRHGRPHHD